MSTVMWVKAAAIKEDRAMRKPFQSRIGGNMARDRDFSRRVIRTGAIDSLRRLRCHQQVRRLATGKMTLDALACGNATGYVDDRGPRPLSRNTRKKAGGSTPPAPGGPCA